MAYEAMIYEGIYFSDVIIIPLYLDVTSFTDSIDIPQFVFSVKQSPCHIAVPSFGT